MADVGMAVAQGGRLQKLLTTLKDEKAKLDRKVKSVKEEHQDFGSRLERKAAIAAGGFAAGLARGKLTKMVKDEKTGKSALTAPKVLGIPPGLVAFGAATLLKKKLGKYGDLADNVGDGAMAFEIGTMGVSVGNKWRLQAEEEKNKKPKDQGQVTESSSSVKGLPDGGDGRRMSDAERERVAALL